MLYLKSFTRKKLCKGKKNQHKCFSSHDFGVARVDIDGDEEEGGGEAHHVRVELHPRGVVHFHANSLDPHDCIRSRRALSRIRITRSILYTYKSGWSCVISCAHALPVQTQRSTRLAWSSCSPPLASCWSRHPRLQSARTSPRTLGDELRLDTYGS